jgi:uncharacterized membrane protein
MIVMKDKSWVWMLFITSGLLLIGSGLQYFVGGKAYQNTDLRNYAVVGQIIFGLATICYGFWYQKNLSKRNK